MKLKKIGAVTLSALGICQVSNAEALLIDVYNTADPASYTTWVNAGVTEDIADAAGGTFHGGNGAIFNIDNMTVGYSGTNGAYQGGVPGNNMLNDYIYVNAGTASISIGGFDDGFGTAVTMTSTLGDMSGNTFTLQANQDYKLYLFGAGDVDGQDTSFTFGGVTKTTSPTIVAAPEDSHYVTYEFTTGSDLTGFTLDFTFSDNTAAYAGWNGAALVAIPEVQSFALLTGLLAVTSIAIRRRK